MDVIYVSSLIKKYLELMFLHKSAIVCKAFSLIGRDGSHFITVARSRGLP